MRFTGQHPMPSVAMDLGGGEGQFDRAAGAKSAPPIIECGVASKDFEGAFAILIGGCRQQGGGFNSDSRCFVSEVASGNPVSNLAYALGLLNSDCS
jgi:hypothetical protein